MLAQQQQQQQDAQHLSTRSSLDSLRSTGILNGSFCARTTACHILLYPSLKICSWCAVHGSDGSHLQPTYQQAGLQQQYNTCARPDSVAHLNDHYRETLAQVSSAIRHDVDRFLVTLPLGTSPNDAAVEEAVASKLYEALLSKAVMQHKLTEWYSSS